jgi:hypothetical protein
VWLCHARLGVFVGQHGGARGVQIGVIVGVVDKNDFTFGSEQPSCVTLRPRLSHD